MLRIDGPGPYVVMANSSSNQLERSSTSMCSSLLILLRVGLRSNLVKRGLDVPCSLCPICRMGVETRDHMFFWLSYGFGFVSSFMPLVESSNSQLARSFDLGVVVFQPLA
nr:hypothetical protein [Tanacetum cinerariifolium]